MERTNFEVYDWLKEHQDKNMYSDEFIESYKDCYFLNRLTGKFFFGTFSGYCVIPENSDKKYFVEDGIRGVSKGYFTVINGKLIEIDPLSDIQNYDKYSDFIKNLSNYVYNRIMSIESLRKINKISDDARIQLDDHYNSLETILQVLHKY